MKKALEIAGPIPDLLDTRGVILLTLNQTKEALRDLEQAADRNPSSPSILFHLARAQLHAQNQTVARSTYEKAKRDRLTPEIIHPHERAEFQREAAVLDQ